MMLFKNCLQTIKSDPQFSDGPLQNESGLDLGYNPIDLNSESGPKKDIDVSTTRNDILPHGVV